jgi:hypothetical protein
MPVMVRWCRALCFGQPIGPWRFGYRSARLDLVTAGLGSYDEEGTFFETVPGGLEIRSEWMSFEEERELSRAIKRRHAPDDRKRLALANHNRRMNRVG